MWEFSKGIEKRLSVEVQKAPFLNEIYNLLPYVMILKNLFLAYSNLFKLILVVLILVIATVIIDMVFSTIYDVPVRVLLCKQKLISTGIV